MKFLDWGCKSKLSRAKLQEQLETSFCLQAAISKFFYWSHFSGVKLWEKSNASKFFGVAWANQLFASRWKIFFYENLIYRREISERPRLQFLCLSRSCLSYPWGGKSPLIESSEKCFSMKPRRSVGAMSVLMPTSWTNSAKKRNTGLGRSDILCL